MGHPRRKHKVGSYNKAQSSTGGTPTTEKENTKERNGLVNFHLDTLSPELRLMIVQ
jgi:hypothetical protein